MKHKKLYLFTGIMALLFFSSHYFGWSDDWGEAKSLEFLTQLAQNHLAAAVLLYTAVTVIGSVVLTLPGITFAVLAGLLFGPVLGTILCAAAATLGAMASFLTGRFFLKDSIKPMVMKNRFLKKWLFDEAGKNELFLLMLTRLVPLFPYNLQNFAYGITDIRFGTYSLYSFLFMLPGTAMYTVGTAGLANRENRAFYLGIAAILAVAVTGLGFFFKKRYMNQPEKVRKFTGNQANACIHCHICQKHCCFLQKYQIDIGDTERLLELAHHCFLCGKCTAVCPVGIDGRQLVLTMRRFDAGQLNGGCRIKGYGLLLAEKKRYLFRNARHCKGKSILFPGCNFPAFYPKTARKLIRLVRQKADMGVLYDCCGKPLGELGLREPEEETLDRIKKCLRKAGAEEIVLVCPNCYDFLKDKLDIPVISIYQKLAQLGLGQQIEGSVPLFLPCPDRKDKLWYPWFAPFLRQAPVVIEHTQCCGLGGCASVREPELASYLARQAGQQGHGRVYTYCASCAGNLAKNGCQDPTHLLAAILESCEQPDTKKSLFNRMLFKFW